MELGYENCPIPFLETVDRGGRPANRPPDGIAPAISLQVGVAPQVQRASRHDSLEQSNAGVFEAVIGIKAADKSTPRQQWQEGSPARAVAPAGAIFPEYACLLAGMLDEAIDDCMLLRS